MREVKEQEVVIGKGLLQLITLTIPYLCTILFVATLVSMNILGIETTCDETSFAIVKDGKKIVSQLIASQEKIHLPFGGVVPELACRHHIDALTPLLSETLKRANLKMDDIDAIAVANGPGLIGALLIGIHFAKGLA